MGVQTASSAKTADAPPFIDATSFEDFAIERPHLPFGDWFSRSKKHA